MPFEIHPSIHFQLLLILHSRGCHLIFILTFVLCLCRPLVSQYRTQTALCGLKVLREKKFRVLSKVVMSLLDNLVIVPSRSDFSALFMSAGQIQFPTKNTESLVNKSPKVKRLT